MKRLQISIAVLAILLLSGCSALQPEDAAATSETSYAQTARVAGILQTLTNQVPTLTLTSQPSSTVTLTPTPSSTFTPVMTLTPTDTPLPASYATFNINDFGTYTLYWKRDLWLKAISGIGQVQTEDFESDPADPGTLTFPYLTGKGFLLDGSQVTAQILDDPTLMMDGHALLFRCWGTGLRFTLPDGKPTRAFGFDFRSGEDWQLLLQANRVPLTIGQRGFIGVLFPAEGPLDFTLSSPASAQGGIAIDNLSYLVTAAP